MNELNTNDFFRQIKAKKENIEAMKIIAAYDLEENLWWLNYEKNTQINSTTKKKNKKHD